MIENQRVDKGGIIVLVRKGRGKGGESDMAGRVSQEDKKYMVLEGFGRGAVEH
jgi:hypothetical protein